ncbi:2-iminoacetate synthase ThiH [Clostridium cellulovorans]|uniref:Thiazole biosynthesis protein ThiH n=1 Tax=Clostridium cellulovorans (strain ATCC 35296 / DSM 3052 / OCM 3 / 743B) TaxID=573061 RepID=D9SRT8_CLOC7|nr:2-iminoacetate synthase ThiH [Clostridium cellulovorans]ADL50455.1 thiazole biosynthesis protein ThiH [Clostridium cellulovorans 743B]
MSFYNKYLTYKDFDFDSFFEKVTDNDVIRSINAEFPTELDYLTLLSAKASAHLEAMAQKANRLTTSNFGKTINIFTPLYLSNICTNHCVYCGFNTSNHIPRKKLSLEEVEIEGKAISEEGFGHVVILTGDARAVTPVSYIADCARVLKKYLHSIAVEVYSLTIEEYEELVAAGVDSFTMFQEVYNEDLYPKLHPKGPKSDYHFRLDAPERACKAKMHNVNIGALLGLDSWQKESFFTGLHGKYLQDNYPGTDIAISLPRIRPHAGNPFMPKGVDDKSLVQAMTALRIFMPRCGITISTRETPSFRENIIGLGVTKMSAGSITEVGGHAVKEEESVPQFEISDDRGLEEFSKVIINRGYQPILKDWEVLI